MVVGSARLVTALLARAAGPLEVGGVGLGHLEGGEGAVEGGAR